MATTVSGPFYFVGPKSKGNAKKDSRHHLFDAHQEKGECHGPFAEYLGFKQTISKDEYENLLQGFSPDGTQKLVRNAGDPDRWSYLQIICATPKDVSAVFAAGDEDWKVGVLNAHNCGIHAVKEYIQLEAALTRRGPDGEIIERAILLPITFLHYDSQSNDPHLNTHIIIPNICLRSDGTTGAILNTNLFLEVRAMNTIYESEVAKHLTETFGLKIKPLDVGGFEIEGVPKELSIHFSSRRTAMNAELKKHNANSPEAQQIAALHTRGNKTIVPKEELFAKWQKEAKSFGFGPEEVRKLVSKAPSVAKDQGSEFKKEFQELIRRTPKTKQTSWHLTRAARKLAIEMGAGAKETSSILQTEVPKNKKFIRVEWKPLARKAPFWSPTKLIKTPRIVIGEDFKRWDKIRWEKKSIVGHMRIQERLIFPKAKFGPLKDLKLPALRFGKMRLREKELWESGKPGLKVLGGELRIQKRRLFPRAMPWTGAEKLSISVPRFIPNSEIKKGSPNSKRIHSGKRASNHKTTKTHEHSM